MAIIHRVLRGLGLVLVAAFAGTAMAQPAAGTSATPAAAADGPRGNLVSAGWLQRHLGQPDLLLLDASGTQAFQAQHIPGAVGVDLYRYGVKEASAAEMERRLQSWGVNAARRIVVYDQGGSMMATWLFFELLHAGVPAGDLFVLDGGLHQWRAAGGAVTKEPTPAPARGSFRVTGLHEPLRTRLPEMLVASGDRRNHTLVEALEPSWHFGETAFFDRPGHIPHAVMLPSGDFYNADKTFKSADDMRRMLGYLGVQPEQQIHSYCGGGVAATVPFFALKFIAGYPRVRLYKESQLEWLQDERSLPVWTYGAPYLMRETRWLNTWGGKMMRMYGGAQISIVDVRPAEAYRQGHVPFAINVPATVFRSHLREPARLAEALARAGVKATDEAVVVSENGLDANAALAWLMLESLGQKKVSVFMDSIDRWAELGFEVARPAVVAAAAAASGAASAPKPAAPAAAAMVAAPRPVPYAAEPRKDVLVADAGGDAAGGVGAAGAPYPKVYVASGRETPTKAPTVSPAGKVVHLPVTDVIQANGTPKAAKDLWKAFVKAGVPRYAEIVLFADDPADAAANHFIFKLMGFPDVKVWLR